jgi:hypothetical protein
VDLLLDDDERPARLKQYFQETFKIHFQIQFISPSEITPHASFNPEREN